MAAASAAGRALISGLPAAGNTIFWAASWLCTSVDTTEWPHTSSPPPIARTTARTRPAIVAIASKVFLRISGASSYCSGLLRSGVKSFVEQSTVSLQPGPHGRVTRPHPAGPPSHHDLGFLPAHAVTHASARIVVRGDP